MTSQVKVKRARWRWDRDLTTFVLQNWKLSKIKQKPEKEPVTHQEDHCLAFKFTIYCSCRSKSIKETRQCYWTIGGFNFTTYNTCKNKTSNKNNKRVVTIFIWFQSQFLLDYNTPLRDCPLLCTHCTHSLHSKLGFLLFLTGSLNSNTALLLKLAKCQKGPSGHCL